MKRLTKFTAQSLVALFAMSCLIVPTNKVRADGIEINDTNFPDKYMKIQAFAVDSNLNGYLDSDEIESTTQIALFGSKISNTKGLENFTNLKSLTLSGCGLTTINLSPYTKLEELDLSNNKLKEIDVSMLSKLSSLSVAYNQLQELDVTNNSSLTSLNCSSNMIYKPLNLSYNMFLKKVDISSNNYLREVEFYCPFLRELNCSSTPIKNIDFSQFPSLTTLQLFSTDLESIDLSKNINLEVLNISCFSSDISDIDLSKCTNLYYLMADHNRFDSFILPENSLTELHINNFGLTNLDLSDQTKLNYLYCNENELTSLTLPKNSLIELYVRGNKLTSLDLSQQTKLKILNCSYNNLTSLNVSDCKNICCIIANENDFTTFDINSLEMAKQNFQRLDVKDYHVEIIKESYNNEPVNYYSYRNEFGDNLVLCSSIVAVDNDVSIIPLTASPTTAPDEFPWVYPTATPTPTKTPTNNPTVAPTKSPATPTSTPSKTPTAAPTAVPNGKPTSAPPAAVTSKPTTPTVVPTNKPGSPTVATSVPTKPTATPTPKPSKPQTGVSDKSGTVEDFAERLYTTCLGRDAEEAGKNYWVGELKAGKPGSEVAEGFFFSPEFTGLNLSNEEYITRLYRTFMGREPDQDGMNYWLGEMKNGQGRVFVFDGFVNSPEWADICLTYGIRSGGLADPTFEKQASKEVLAFAERLYTTCLGRDAEPEGLKYWSQELANLRQTGTVAASGFFNSPEFIGLKTDDNEYVTRLYRTFMGREPEKAGFDYWMSELKAGKDRQYVFDGFSVAPEFANLCAEAGIMR